MVYSGHSFGFTSLVSRFVSLLLLLTKTSNIEKKKTEINQLKLKWNEYQKGCLASLLKIVSS